MGNMPIIYVEIQESVPKLVCEGIEETFPVNEVGGKGLGHKLYTNEIDDWMYSSSVDHPDEYGVTEDVHLRGAIEAGYKAGYQTAFDNHVVKVAAEEGITEEQVRTVLKRFGAMKEDT